MKRGAWRIVALAALQLASGNASGQATMQTLLSSGPTGKRLNIVFLSEGYTANELSGFPPNAMAMLDTILSTSPFREYTNYFNAFAISVPSNQSGSDHFTPTDRMVDTYFNSQYDSFGIQRLISIDSVGLSRVHSLLAQFMPEYDIVALVVNDTQYGGSGGFPLIASINDSSAEIATHELGHSFAGLADEYETAFPGFIPEESPNATALTNLTLIRWNRWIPEGTPIPTPTNYSVIGLFQGALYSTNFYRPKYDCKMRRLNVPFCEVCAETLVKSMYTRLSPIQEFSPATDQMVPLTNGLASSFSVSNQLPSSHSLAVQWFLNGSPSASATSAVFTISGFDLASGANSLSVQVSDLTPLVRNDPSGVLVQTLQWQLSPVVVSPLISIHRSSLGEVNLSWPPIAAGFFLETEPALPPSSTWTPLLLISNQTGIALPSDRPQSIFRLSRP